MSGNNSADEAADDDTVIIRDIKSQPTPGYATVRPSMFRDGNLSLIQKPCSAGCEKTYE